LILAIIVAVGLSIRAYHLADRSMWFDEAFSWRVIQYPFAEMIDRTAQDNHPPLYFVLLRGWAAAFGTTELALRWLSVALGGLAMVGMYLFMTEGFADKGAPKSRRLGFLVAALLGLSVFQIRWAWECRMYTLGTALAALSSWALFRALRRPVPSFRPWLAYGILALLFAYTHYYALFSIAAQAMFLGGYFVIRARGRIGQVVADRRFWYALLAGGIIAAGWLPWVPFFLKQRSQVQADYWSQPVGLWNLANTCYQMFVDPQDAHFGETQALVAAGLVGLGALALLWRARAGEWYLLTAAGVPFGLSVLVSHFDTKIYSLRFFLFAHLFLLAGLGVLLSRIRIWSARLLVVGLVLSYQVCLCAGFWLKLDIAHKGGARAAIASIARQRRPGEPVVVSEPMLFFSTKFYAADEPDWYLFDAGHGVRHYEGGPILNPNDLINAAQVEQLQTPRLWAVEQEGGMGPLHKVPVPPGWLELTRERFPEVYGFQGDIVVVEYCAPHFIGAFRRADTPSTRRVAPELRP
jgi:hypothetical protein